MRVVSDLNAASESEIKKWRTLYKKQKKKAKANSLTDTIAEITNLCDRNTS
jgi:hypothetical protein